MPMNRGLMRAEYVAAYLEARAILQLIGPDPDGEQHMRDLERAIGALCRGCDQPARSLGWCDTHYRAHRRATCNEAHLINRKAAA